MARGVGANFMEKKIKHFQGFLGRGQGDKGVASQKIVGEPLFERLYEKKKEVLLMFLM